MNSWLTTIFVLADELERAPKETTPSGGDGSWGFMTIMLPALAVMLVLQIILRRGESSEKTKREQLIGELKKNDPIVTIGGIKGTFVSISEDKSEITIKVDDNTRLKVEASAIREFGVKKAEQAANS